jgi:hypothetical protein
LRVATRTNDRSCVADEFLDHLIRKFGPEGNTNSERIPAQYTGSVACQYNKVLEVRIMKPTVVDYMDSTCVASTGGGPIIMAP